MTRSQKKNAIIGGLLVIVLVMAIGYAAFAQNLQINGTSNITSTWDVEITNIETLSKKGAEDNQGSPDYDNSNGLTASFSTKLTSPGDYETYKIEITNKGSLDAVLSNINMPESTNNDIKFYLNKDNTQTDIAEALTQNSVLTKAGTTGNKGYVYVTVLYRDYPGQTSPSGTAATASADISFTFTQSNGNGGSAEPSDSTQTVYTLNRDANNRHTLDINDPFYSIFVTYPSPEAAMNAWSGVLTTTSEYYGDTPTTARPYFLMHKLGEFTATATATASATATATASASGGSIIGGITESYVGFIVTPKMVNDNPGMKVGTYYIRGAVNERSLDSKPIYESNKAEMLKAFGSTYCTDNGFNYGCNVPGLNVNASDYGHVDANVGADSFCDVSSGGNSRCSD